MHRNLVTSQPVEDNAMADLAWRPLGRRRLIAQGDVALRLGAFLDGPLGIVEAAVLGQLLQPGGQLLNPGRVDPLRELVLLQRSAVRGRPLGGTGATTRRYRGDHSAVRG